MPPMSPCQTSMTCTSPSSPAKSRTFLGQGDGTDSQDAGDRRNPIGDDDACRGWHARRGRQIPSSRCPRVTHIGIDQIAVALPDGIIWSTEHVSHLVPGSPLDPPGCDKACAGTASHGDVDLFTYFDPAHQPSAASQQDSTCTVDGRPSTGSHPTAGYRRRMARQGPRAVVSPAPPMKPRRDRGAPLVSSHAR